MRCDVIVNYLNAQVSQSTGEARSIIRLAGDVVMKQCKDYLKRVNGTDHTRSFCTEAGPIMKDIKRIVHIILPGPEELQVRNETDRESEIMQTMYEALLTADKLGVQSLAIPAVSPAAIGLDEWTIAHAMVKTICKFDEETSTQPGGLRDVRFVSLTITYTDILTVVLKEMLLTDQQPETEKRTDKEADTGQSRQPQAEASAQDAGTPTRNDSQWYEVDRLLQKKRIHGKQWYLVQWADKNEKPSWIQTSDVSELAIREFNARQPSSHRRRRRC